MVRRAGSQLSSKVLHRPLPEPPAVLRQGPLREGAFSSRLHSERTASWLGLWLGITFSVAFVTGLVSHGIQDPPAWFVWPSRPVNLYRFTQGLHVATGIAAVPLLLAKLWTVYPKLWEWPPARDLAHAVERLALFVLVAGALFQLATGLMNIGLWYAFGFFFTTVHYWTAWVVMGAIVVHVGTKLTIARRGLSRSSPDLREEPAGDGLSRRGFLTAVGVTTGVVTVATVGQTVAPLQSISLLAPRRPDTGVQGVPVNKSAAAAGVRDTARDPGYRLVVEGAVGRPLDLRLEDLRAMPQSTSTLPITCVEGWSATANWSGVRLRDLLSAAGAAAGASVRVESLERGGLYRSSVVSEGHAHDPLTLLALRLDGEDLDLDHGFPCRLIAPSRPGVMQTKWVERVVVL